MTLHLIIHTLVTTVITWVGMITIIIADMFSWSYLIGCFLGGVVVAIPITHLNVGRIESIK